MGGIMSTFLLIIFLLLTLAMIGVILLQRSEGGGLGIGGSSGGGMGGFMSGRGTANLLTRTTAILGTLFFVLALTMALLDRGTALNRSILEEPPAAPAAPAIPAVPSVPTN
jgi:preprotein translocase subunit SecG